MRYVFGLAFALAFAMGCSPQVRGLAKGVLRSTAILADLPVIEYSALTYSFVMHQAADTTTPTLESGTLTSCTVSPALPAGLTLTLADCRISGSPLVALSATSFTVTPSGPSGNGAAVTLSIEIANIVPDLTYSAATYRSRSTTRCLPRAFPRTRVA